VARVCHVDAALIREYSEGGQPDYGCVIAAASLEFSGIRLDAPT
jgi:hypothetical protein